MTTTSPGAPPGKRSSPGGFTSPQGRSNALVAATATTTNTDMLTERDAEAQRLVAQIGDQAAADDARFRMAYKLGFDSGVEVGRQQLGNEILAEDERLSRHMSTVRRLPIYTELERTRWDGRREDFAQPRADDFKGFGPAYEPPTTGETVRQQWGAA